MTIKTSNKVGFETRLVKTKIYLNILFSFLNILNLILCFIFCSYYSVNIGSYKFDDN